MEKKKRREIFSLDSKQEFSIIRRKQKNVSLSMQKLRYLHVSVSSLPVTLPYNEIDFKRRQHRKHWINQTSARLTTSTEKNTIEHPCTPPELLTTVKKFHSGSKLVAFPFWKVRNRIDLELVVVWSSLRLTIVKSHDVFPCKLIEFQFHH